MFLKMKLRKLFLKLYSQAENNEILCYEELCKETGLRTRKEKEAGFDILMQWILENPDYDLIGDEYMPFSVDNIFIIQKISLKDEKLTPAFLEKLVFRARICQKRGGYYTAKEFYGRVYIIAFYFSVKNNQYLAYCGEAKKALADIKKILGEDDYLQDYKIAFNCYKTAGESLNKISLQSACPEENYEIYKNIDYWFIYQLANCCEEIGKAYLGDLKYYHRSESTISKAEIAVEYYTTEFQLMTKLFMDFCPAAQENKDMYENAIQGAMCCYSIMWDFETAETYYSALDENWKHDIPGRLFLAEAYRDYASEQEDSDEKEKYLKRSLEILLEKCYDYFPDITLYEEVVKKYHFTISQVCGELSILYSELGDKTESNIYENLEKHYFMIYNYDINILDNNKGKK